MFRNVSISLPRLNIHQIVIEINLSISESKVKFMEKIGVKSKQMRRRSVGGINLREKSASYPNCHSIRNDASIIEIGKRYCKVMVLFSEAKISSSNLTKNIILLNFLDIESKLGDLTLLLHDETSRKLFRNFLKKEHSEENLDFWMAVDSYRSRDIIRAKYIYSKFLAPGALCEVSYRTVIFT